MTGYEVVMSDTAVLVVDMLNAYRHEDAELLAPNVADIIDPLVEVIARARESDDVDVIYVNGNYGDFTADHNDIVRSALEGERPDLVKPIVPDEDCLFLEKVRHSAFYTTSLAYLLRRLETRRLILTGQAPSNASSTPHWTPTSAIFLSWCHRMRSRTSTLRSARRR